MNINNREITRTESITLLGVFLDKNLSWKPHINYIKNEMLILVQIDRIVSYAMFLKTPLASSQGGIVIKYLVQLNFIYYYRSGNKNICQGICKFGIIGLKLIN